jgi:hypothetical protein
LNGLATMLVHCFLPFIFIYACSFVHIKQSS